MSEPVAWHTLAYVDSTHVDRRWIRHFTQREREKSRLRHLDETLWVVFTVILSSFIFTLSVRCSFVWRDTLSSSREESKWTCQRRLLALNSIWRSFVSGKSHQCAQMKQSAAARINDIFRTSQRMCRRRRENFTVHSDTTKMLWAAAAVPRSRADEKRLYCFGTLLSRSYNFFSENLMMRRATTSCNFPPRRVCTKRQSCMSTLPWLAAYTFHTWNFRFYFHPYQRILCSRRDVKKK